MRKNQIKDIKDEVPIHLGKYGYLRADYLKSYHKVKADEMMSNGTWWSHLIDVDTRAYSQIEEIVGIFMEVEGVTEEVKAKDPMMWLGLVNNLTQAAEEIILPQLIYPET